MKNVRKLD